jgi:hypothetical protein
MFVPQEPIVRERLLDIDHLLPPPQYDDYKGVKNDIIPFNASKEHTDYSHESKVEGAGNYYERKGKNIIYDMTIPNLIGYERIKGAGNYISLDRQRTFAREEERTKKWHHSDNYYQAVLHDMPNKVLKDQGPVAISGSGNYYDKRVIGIKKDEVNQIRK